MIYMRTTKTFLDSSKHYDLRSVFRLRSVGLIAVPIGQPEERLMVDQSKESAGSQCCLDESIVKSGADDMKFKLMA